MVASRSSRNHAPSSGCVSSPNSSLVPSDPSSDSMVEISWTPRPPLSPLPDEDDEAAEDDDDDEDAPPMPRIANMPDRSNRCCVVNRRSRNICARVSTVPCRLYVGLGSTLYVFVRSSKTTFGLLNA